MRKKIKKAIKMSGKIANGMFMVVCIYTIFFIQIYRKSSSENRNERYR